MNTGKLDRMKRLFGSRKAANSVTHEDYASVKELDADMNRCGAGENLNLMVFIDRTSSNKNTGRQTFQSKNLHTISDGIANPYQMVFRSLQDVIGFNQHAQFPTYAYGSKTATLFRNKLHFLGMCRNSAEVERVYCDTTDLNDQARPTCFRYIINEAIRVTKETGQYYVVLIITDGSPDPEFTRDDVDAIFEAMQYPLSIVVVGVGDGPFDFMEQLDDMKLEDMGLDKKHIKELQKCSYKFDNFQFVKLSDITSAATVASSDPFKEAYFRIFMEVPNQYRWIISRQQFKPSQARAGPYPATEIIREHQQLQIAPPIGFLEDAPAYSKEASAPAAALAQV